jgi:hypothetical protein
VPDVVGEGCSLLPPPSGSGALAAALEETMRDPGAAKIRATAARERLLEECALKPWLSDHEGIYASK